jgi:XTP/dITP diphosphohydrolase
MQKWVIASNNQGKVNEFNTLLHDCGIEVVTQKALGIDSVPETGLTFVENALLKARHAARVSGLSALADDSGLVVPALNGAPGLYSARYAGETGDPNLSTDRRNLEKLLLDCEALEGPQRQAFYLCILVLLQHPEDPAPLICEGRWHGFIARAPAGQQGFGYDPVFIPAGQLGVMRNFAVADANADADGQHGSLTTVAQMDKATKNKFSHRGKALRQLMEKLNTSII